MMNEEGEVKSTPPAPHLHPQPHPDPVPAGIPMPVPPPGVGGIYPSAVAAAYPSPAPVAYPPGSATVHPPGSSAPAPPAFQTPYYAPGYPNHTGGAAEVVQTTNLKNERLPCWGLGFGWFLFIIGFFLATIPWYVGAFFLLFLRVDYREQPGYIACAIAAVIAAICAVFGMIRHVAGW